MLKYFAVEACYSRNKGILNSFRAFGPKSDFLWAGLLGNRCYLVIFFFRLCAIIPFEGYLPFDKPLGRVLICRDMWSSVAPQFWWNSFVATPKKDRKVESESKGVGNYLSILLCIFSKDDSNNAVTITR